MVFQVSSIEGGIIPEAALGVDVRWFSALGDQLLCRHHASGGDVFTHRNTCGLDEPLVQLGAADKESVAERLGRDLLVKILFDILHDTIFQRLFFRCC